MLWADPSPEQIRQRAEQIRNQWPPGEEMKRRSGLNLEERAALGWQPPRLDNASIAAARREAAVRYDD
jgi:hypothetical protein